MVEPIDPRFGISIVMLNPDTQGITALIVLALRNVTRPRRSYYPPCSPEKAQTSYRTIFLHSIPISNHWRVFYGQLTKVFQGSACILVTLLSCAVLNAPKDKNLGKHKKDRWSNISKYS